MAATMLISGCGDTSASETASTTPATMPPAADPPSATTMPTDDGDELFLALESSGVDLGAAPTSVRSLDGAVWCGMEQRQQEVTAETVLDEVARRCFLERHRSAQPAVFVEEYPTIEGDPIVTVWRTSDDGTVEVHVDRSRDTYGAGQWSSQRCPRLTIGFPERSEPAPAGYFACSANDPPEPLGGGLDGPVVYASPADSGEEALAVGIVQLIDGCLYLGDSSDGLDPVTLVWKAGTRWDPITSEVLLPDGTRLPIGTSISAGGGYHPAGAMTGFVTDPEALSKVAQCATAGNADGVFVVQHPVEVEP